MHNDKRSPNVAALVKVMKKHRLRTVPDYTALLKKKWGISESVQEEPPRFIDMGAGEERDYEIRKFIQALIAQSQSDRGLWLPAAEFYELDMQEKTRAALKMINAHKDEARPVGSKWAAEFLRKVFMP